MDYSLKLSFDLNEIYELEVWRFVFNTIFLRKWKNVSVLGFIYRNLRGAAEII